MKKVMILALVMFTGLGIPTIASAQNKGDPNSSLILAIENLTEKIETLSRHIVDNTDRVKIITANVNNLDSTLKGLSKSLKRMIEP